MTGDWHTGEERGSAFGIRLLDGTSRLLGRRPARLILRCVMLYFVLFGGAATRESRRWLELHLERVRRRDIYRHLFTFGTCALDRFLLVRRRTGPFALSYEGREHLERLKAEGRGGILLGGHLGSFEAMSAFAREHDSEVYAAMYTQHARRITRMLQSAAPDVAERIVELKEGDPGVILRLKRLVEGGAFVALLGDRAAGGRTVTVDFFGRPAQVAAGPYLLAAALKCPTLTCACLYEEPNGYRLVVEPFAEAVELPRRGRDEAVQRYAQQFADWLADKGRAHPFNWFNFFDFWDRGDDGGAASTHGQKS